GISCSLKVIARLVGLVPIEVDRERIHELSREVLDAYVASDARLARQLTERRRPGGPRFVARIGPPPPALAGVSPPPPRRPAPVARRAARPLGTGASRLRHQVLGRAARLAAAARPAVAPRRRSPGSPVRPARPPPGARP